MPVEKNNLNFGLQNKNEIIRMITQTSQSGEQHLKRTLKEIKRWTPDCDAPMPRIVVFGQSGSGKSSLLNSLCWVTKFVTKNSPGEFIQEVPSSRQHGVHGGGNTNRLTKIRIEQMEFVDTAGYPAGALHIFGEVKRICEGYRDFTTDIKWDERTYRIKDFFKIPGRRMDFAILVVSARNLDLGGCQKMVTAIKDNTGCIPVIVVTSKDSIPKGEEGEIHAQLTGMGASRALFVENYLIDSEGIEPTDEDIDIEKHHALCKVMRTIQRDYDQHLTAIKDSSNQSSCQAVITTICKRLLMLLIIGLAIFAILFKTFCYLYYLLIKF